MLYNPGSMLLAHTGQAGRLMNPLLWRHAQGQMLAPDGTLRGRVIIEDFTTFGGLVASNVGQYSGEAGHYTSYEDTGGSIKQLATEPTGVIRLLTDNTDNDENWLCSGGATSILGMISDTAGSDKLTGFSARVRPNFVADNEMAWFVGLTEEGLAAADTKADNTGVLADKDFIGFDVVQANGDALNVVYRKSGGAQQTVISGVQALTAATWYNVGLLYDPKAPTTQRIKFFVDNVVQSTYVTGANIAAATFPDGEELNFLIGMKNGSGAIASLDCDGWGFFQAE